MEQRISARKRRERTRRAPLREIADMPFEYLDGTGDLRLMLACGHSIRELDYELDADHIPIPDARADGDVYLFRCGACARG